MHACTHTQTHTHTHSHTHTRMRDTHTHETTHTHTHTHAHMHAHTHTHTHTHTISTTETVSLTYLVSSPLKKPKAWNHYSEGSKCVTTQTTKIIPGHISVSVMAAHNAYLRQHK